MVQDISTLSSSSWLAWGKTVRNKSVYNSKSIKLLEID